MSADFVDQGTRAKPFTVLFLCTGNSARSVIAEALLNRLGAGRFRAYSAGSRPRGEVHPQTLALLHRLGYDTSTCRSKSWDEFSRSGAPHVDFIITVCDDAAAESCPVWPGKPVSAHWGLPDPAAATGTDAQIALAFSETYRMMGNRIGAFCSLPLASLSRKAAKQEMDRIGLVPDATYSAPKP